MSNTLVYRIRLEDGGTISVSADEARRLNSELRAATQSAREYNKVRTAGDTSAVRNSQLHRELGAYGVARSSAGTGAASRDFAKQASGLGGLVHVYATFAANLFAVTAAFNAMSKAADTQNMIKSAGVLSATYGVSLKNVAAAIKEVTDGAVNMHDALAMANLGGSAGLSSKTMKDLALVAKGASVALGRDMADAITRVYRGAIKIEPELLDELGIMVKVEEASKEYARTVGKTAAQLSQYEKQQAFANAVAEQGIRKYKELADAAANPFSKLAASVQDLGTSTLGAVSNALSPIINMLSESPVALSLGLAGIVKLLLNQAIPAVADMNKAWLEGLKSQKQYYNDIRNSIVAQVKEQERLSAVATQAELDARASITRVHEAKAITSYRKSTKMYVAADAYLHDSLNEQKKAHAIDMLDKEIVKHNKNLEKYNKLLAEGKVLSTYNKKEGYTLDHITNIENKKKELESWRKDLLQVAVASNTAETAAEAARIAQERYNRERVQAVNIEKSIRKAEIKSQALEVLESSGGSMSIALAKLKDDIKQLGPEYSKFEKFKLRLVGSISVIGAGIMSLASKIAMWSMIIEGGVLVLEGLARWAGIFSDSSSKAAASTDKLNESSKVLNDSLTRLSKATSLGEIFSLKTSSFSALVELNTQLKETLSLYEKFRTDENGSLNRVFDSLSKYVGFGTSKDAISSFAKQYGATSRASGNDALRQNALNLIQPTKQLQGLYANTSDEELVKQYLNRVLNEGGTEALSEAFKNLHKSMDPLVKSSEKQRNAFMNVKSGIEELNKNTSDYINNLTAMTPATKAASQMFQVFGNAIETMDAIALGQAANTLGKQSQYMSGILLPPNVQKAVDSINNYTKSLSSDLTDEEKKVRIEAKTKEMFSPGTEGFKELVAYSTDVGLKFKDLAIQSFKLSEAQAAFSKQLRKLGQLEGIIGVSASSTSKRIDLENASKSAEEKILREEQDRLKLMRGSLVESLGVPGVSNSQSADSIIKASSFYLKSLSSGADAKDRAQEIARVTQSMQNILPIIIKEYEIESKRKVLQMSMTDYEERRRLILTQSYEDEAKRTKDLNSLERERLQIEDNVLSAKAQIYSESSATFEAEKLGIAYQIQKLDLSDKEAELAKTIGQQEAYLRQAKEQGLSAELAKQIDISGKRRKLLESEKEGLALQLKAVEVQQQKIVLQDRLNKISTSTSSIFSAIDSLTSSIFTTEELTASLLESKEKNTTALYTEQKKFLEFRLSQAKDAVTIQAILNEKLALDAKYNADTLDIMLQQHEVQKKLVDMGRSSQSTSSIVSTEFTKRAYEFRKGIKSQVDVVFDSVYSGIDKGIDTIIEKLQKGEKLSFKDVIVSVRQTMAGVFFDAAKENFKMAYREIFNNAFGNKSYEQNMQDYTQRISTAVESLDQKVPMGGSFVPITDSGTGVKGSVFDLSNTSKDTGFMLSEGAKSIEGTASDMAKKMSDEAALVEEQKKITQTEAASTAGFITGMGNVIRGFTGSMGIFGNAVNFLITWLPKILTAQSATSSISDTGGNILTKIIGGLAGSYFGGSSTAGFSAGDLGSGISGSLNMGSSFQGLSYTPRLYANARGGIYSGALSKYHNSIVTSPTTFAFAKGGAFNRGLMGEAGPEAIIPLKRDDRGNLGIRGNQGKVEVVVNNFSNAKAETKETQDARGNRRIEVMIGDAVSSEMNRPGSKTNATLRSNTGTQPPLVRR